MKIMKHQFNSQKPYLPRSFSLHQFFNLKLNSNRNTVLQKNLLKKESL